MYLTPSYENTSIFNPCPEGEKEIASGRVACILLAGGQGSRLGSDAPKGLFPLRGKTLFEHFFEKVKAAILRTQRPLYVAVMVSAINREASESYFRKMNWFGLSEEHVLLFEQTMLPCLDEKGNALPDKAPNGNGEVFHLMEKNGMLKFLQEKGVTSLQVMPIDNPLAFPFDPHMALFHKMDLVIKACKRASTEEAVGIICAKDGHPFIAEYSEVSSDIKTAKDSKGDLLFSLANTGLFSFSMNFAKKAALQALPLHKALKKVGNQTVIKQETFIFDLFVNVQSYCVLLYPREEIFAPLKNSQDVAKVEKALIAQAALISSIDPIA